MRLRVWRTLRTAGAAQWHLSAIATTGAVATVPPPLLASRSTSAFASPGQSASELVRSSSPKSFGDLRRSTQGASASAHGQAALWRTLATMTTAKDRNADTTRSSSAPATTLPGFLKSCKAHIAGVVDETEEGGRQRDGNDDASKSGKDIVHAYSGNEACDADSICSAICLAFLAHATSGALRDEDRGVIHVPVMPIPRADLGLRREVLVLFELCGVDPSDVTFIDDVDLPQLRAEGRLRLTLADHNAVSGNLAGLGDATVEIVDHHMDLGEHSHVQGRSRDIAFEGLASTGTPLVGSCCTLVAEKILEADPDLLTAGVARLLLGVILVDTVNLDVDAKRATSRDVTAAQKLADLALVEAATTATTATAEGAGPPLSSMRGLFDVLRNAKFDLAFWSELSPRDCLRYDYKEFSPRSPGAGSKIDSLSTSENDRGEGKAQESLRFGMSSVLCRVDTLAAKSDAAEAIRDFAAERGVDSLAIMTSTLGQDDKMRKELLLFAPEGAERREQMRTFFEGGPGEMLQLRRSGGSDGSAGFAADNSEESSFLHWEMGNVAPSRKQVAPMLIAFYEALGR